MENEPQRLQNDFGGQIITFPNLVSNQFIESSGKSMNDQNKPRRFEHPPKPCF